jgi:hypothetical protein
MKITKENLEQIIKEEIEAVLNEEVTIHGSQINGRDVYYVKDKNDDDDAGLVAIGPTAKSAKLLSTEKQAEHCRSRRNPGYYSGLPAENVKWDKKRGRCVYDRPRNR